MSLVSFPNFLELASICIIVNAPPVYLKKVGRFFANHSRPQSPSFLGHVVEKRGALEAAVTGCQKISDIRLRMCRSYKYHCSCS